MRKKDENNINFEIFDTNNPYCYAYITNNNKCFIHWRNNINENYGIKINKEGNKLIFYPSNKNSKLFDSDFKVKIDLIINLILENELNILAIKIYEIIENLKKIIIFNKKAYISRIESLKYSLKIKNNTQIDVNIIKDSIIENTKNIAKNNIIDSNINMFSLIFPKGINDTNDILAYMNLPEDIVKHYYNKSNLSNSLIEQKTNININSYIIVLSYYISHLYIRDEMLENKNNIKINKILDCEVIIKDFDIPNIEPKTIVYSNNDIKITLQRDKIIIENLIQEIVVINYIKTLYSLKGHIFSEILIDNLKLPIKGKNKYIVQTNDCKKINIKNIVLSMLGNKISNKIQIKYITDSPKQLIGNSKI